MLMLPYYTYIKFCISARMFGDPHFKTLNGKTYTFNGWGEYVLTRGNTGDGSR